MFRALEAPCEKNNSKLIWTEECELPFQEMKAVLAKTIILCFTDVQRDSILGTNVSFDTVRAVLSQKDDNDRERVMGCESHLANNHKKGTV